MAALDLEEVVEASQTSTMRFDLLKTVALDHGAARVGRLAFHRQRARLPIDTPNFIAITSRGSVPHMTPDVVTRHTQLGGAYMALEDCELYHVWVHARRSSCFPIFREGGLGREP